MKNRVVKYDKAMAAAAKDTGELRFIPFDTPPLRLSGFPFTRPGEKLRRLPDDPRLSDGVRYLSEHTSGGRIDFRTDSRHLAVRVKLRSSSHMYHMPDVGSAGFDLYMGDPGRSFMIGNSRADKNSDGRLASRKFTRL